LRNATASPITRMHALYLLSNLGRLDNSLMTAGLSDKDPIVRKNALRLVAERDLTTTPPDIALVNKLVGDSDPRVQINALMASGTLPLIARWDSDGTLTPELKPLVSQLRARLNETGLSDDQRASVILNLIGVRNLDPAIVPSVASLLGPSTSVPLQTKVLQAL